MSAIDRNTLRNGELGKEILQNFGPEQETVAVRQAASENTLRELTQTKTGFDKDFSFRAKAQCALQEAADFFRQNNDDEAYRVLNEKVDVLYKDGHLTTEQLDTVYRSIVHDPLLNPQTPFSKRQYESVLTLKASALKDLVQFYSAAEAPLTLKNGPAKKAIMKAAERLETAGDEKGACHLLHEVLHQSLSSSDKSVHEELVNEVYRILSDNFSEPTSQFLKKHVEQNPLLLDANQLRAKALDSLSRHLFEPAVVQGTKPLPPMPRLPQRVITQGILSFADAGDIAVYAKASKHSLAEAKKSLRCREEVSLEEMRTWDKMGIVIDRATFPSLRVIRGKIETQEDYHNLMSIITCCPHLEEIELNGERTQIDDHFYLEAIGRFCPNLLRFTLRNCSKGIFIEPLVRECKKLQHINLFGTKLVHRSNNPIEAIAENCPELMSIDIKIENVQDVRILAQKCKNLNHLALRTVNITLGDEVLVEIAKCSKLQTLIIDFDDYPFAPVYSLPFSSAGMRPLVQSCKGLTHLEINRFELERGALAEIGAARLPLKTLVLDCVGPQSTEDIEALAQGVPDVESVSFCYIGLNDDGLNAFGRHCHKISDLNILRNDQISIEGFQSFLKGCPLLTNLSFDPNSTKGFWEVLAKSDCNFTKLDLEDNLLMNTTALVSSEEIIAFVRKNPGLTHLNLRNYLNVNDEVLFAISECLPNLVSLDLSRTNVTPIGIEALGKGCPKIKRLSLSRLNKLDKLSGDLLLTILAENFPRITHLNISGNLGVFDNAYFTSKGFSVLGKGCPYISELDVSCNNLTLKTLETIVNSFFHLQCLLSFRNKGDASKLIKLLVKNSPSATIEC